MSSKWRWLRISSPKGASAASSNKPPWSSANCNSLAEHNMPWLSTPRSFPTLMVKGFPSSPGGNSAPTNAHGTRIPTRALGAPQTMSNKVPEPTSTLHTRSRSALGCCSAWQISPTTILLKAGATGLSSSTSRPAMVSVWASCSVVSAGLQKDRSQDSGNCICFYWNCERKRISPSKNSRKSLTS